MKKGRVTCRLMPALMFLVLAISLLPGCAPYHATGRPIHYKAEGKASWYGPGFSGKKTANGERFDPNAMTAAHKTLPMGTTVRVTNLDNDKSVVVRVNDRGPFVRGRIIDLSKAAAQEIDIIGKGTGRVMVVAITAPPEKFERQEKKTLKSVQNDKKTSTSPKNPEKVAEIAEKSQGKPYF